MSDSLVKWCSENHPSYIIKMKSFWNMDVAAKIRKESWQILTQGILVRHPFTTQQYRKSIQAAHFWEIISKVTDDLSSNDKTKKLKHKHSYTIGHDFHICICCLLPYSRGGKDLTFGTHWQHNYWSNNDNQICIDKEWRALSMNMVKACRGSIHRGAALD